MNNNEFEDYMIEDIETQLKNYAYKTTKMTATDIMKHNPIFSNIYSYGLH